MNGHEIPDHSDNVPFRGETNGNPPGMGLWSLLSEDFRTHGRDILSPGFWALAVHRLGNWRMSVRAKVLRAPLTLAYRAAYHGVVALWGIDIGYTIIIGRRLRLEHHGSMILGASRIGDDVVIGHSVTMGLMQRDAVFFPTIGDRVEIRHGACLVGAIHIGDDCFIGPNTVVNRNLPPGSAVLGIPLRFIDIADLTASIETSSRPQSSPNK